MLIDTTPDFRTQALRARIDRLDAVIFTHSHADHLMGLDDVRPFNFRQKGQIPIFAAPETMAAIQRCFQYIFDGGKKESNVPKLDARVHRRRAVRRLRHGVSARSRSCTARRPSTASASAPPPTSPTTAKFRNRRWSCSHDLDVLFLDALRYKPHPTHSTVERSVRTVEQLAPQRALLHAHLSRPGPRARREHAAAAHPAGLRRPGNSGGGRPLAHEDLPQPGRASARFRPERRHHRQLRWRALRPPADSAPRPGDRRRTRLEALRAHLRSASHTRRRARTHAAAADLAGAPRAR